MTPRQAYVAKWMGALVLIGLAVAGYIHGILWAEGVSGMRAWEHGGGGMPWQAVLIDLSPLWIIIGSCCTWLVSAVFAYGYRMLPKSTTKAERLAAKQAEREDTIARLERELGLAEPADDPEFITLSNGIRVRRGVGERSGK